MGRRLRNARLEDFNSEVFQALEQSADSARASFLVEVTGSKVLVGNVSGEHVVGRSEHRRSHCHDGIHRTAACLEAVEHRAQVGILGARRGPGVRIVLGEFEFASVLRAGFQ